MSKQRRYWDSSAFIAFLAEEPGRVDLCQAVLDKALAGEIEIVTSTITYSEVVWMKGKDKFTPEMEDDVRALFEYDFIIPVVLTRAVSEHARELMWKHPTLRPYDANHLASAKFARVQIVDSFDGHFLKVNGAFTGFDGTPVRIGHPDIPVQTTLFKP